MLLPLVAVLCAGVCPSDRVARAQEQQPGKKTVFAAAGFGIGSTRSASHSRTGFNGAFRAGVHLTGKVAIGLDYEIHDRRDEKPRGADLVITGSGIEVARVPIVLSTRYVFLSLKIRLPENIFIRTGAGLGFHRFVGYSPVYGNPPTGANDPVIERYEGSYSSEGGLAYGIAAGYDRTLTRAITVSIEATYRRGTGEDSSSPRRSIGMLALLSYDL